MAIPGMRREHDTEQLNKLSIVGTICLSSLMIVSTICLLSIKGSQIPPELKDVGLLLLGAITALLAKTGVEAAKDRLAPTGKEIGQGIQQASEENPINTTEVDPKDIDPKELVPIGENH